MFLFFFQAEDGIRDYKVTGVQTCALPILGFTIQKDIPADDAGIGAEVIAPQSMAENSNVTRAGTVFFRRERPPEERMNTKNRKEAGRDRRGLTRFRPFLAANIESRAAVGGHLFKGMVLVLPAEVICRGDREERQSGEALCG